MRYKNIKWSKYHEPRDDSNKKNTEHRVALVSLADLNIWHFLK